jgi:dTDP-4-dehydrorhamnose 3,5-epimerase-like enzyme
MADRFEDERGTIEDLAVGEDWALTRVTTVEGAVRGNHVHDRTTQVTYVVRGAIRYVADREGAGKVTHWATKMPEQVIYDPPGVAHAWQALEDSECLVLTVGPRATDYESDTRRLDEPLL